MEIFISRKGLSFRPGLKIKGHIIDSQIGVLYEDNLHSQQLRNARLLASGTPTLTAHNYAKILSLFYVKRVQTVCRKETT